MRQENQEPEKEVRSGPETENPAASGADTGTGKGTGADTGTGSGTDTGNAAGTADGARGTAPEGGETGADSAGTAEAGDGDAGEVYHLTRAQMEQMEKAVQELETLKDRFLRLSAEYDNYRKRTAREKDALYQDAKADTVKAFLSVYDDLERAVAAPGGEDSPHRKGLEMIFQKYREILEKLGVKEIEAVGKPFDPERENAVQHIEDESRGENEVSQVFQAGFELGGRVIRVAMVQVAN